jgi:hypothetical protein
MGKRSKKRNHEGEGGEGEEGEGEDHHHHNELRYKKVNHQPEEAAEAEEPEEEDDDDFDPPMFTLPDPQNWAGPGMGDIPLQGVSIYSTVPLKELQDKKKKHHPNCFGCQHSFGKPANPTLHVAMNRLYEAFVENRKRMSMQALAELLSTLQYEYFIAPFLGKSLPEGITIPIPWPPALIIEHLLYHARFYEFDLEADYDDLTELCHQTKDLIMKRSELDRTMKGDPQMADVYGKLLKTKHMLYGKLFTVKTRV